MSFPWDNITTRTLGQKDHVFTSSSDVGALLNAHTEATEKMTRGNSSDLLLLSDAVSPSLSLKIILGVPVRIKDNNSISRGQINSQPSSSC